MITRILIVDDHVILREGLRLLIDQQPDMAIVGEACDGSEAIRLTRETRPDIVIMDVNMPDTDGIDATRRILQEINGVKVIALSMYSKKAFITEMLKAGASGYMLKEQAFDELVAAIKTVVSGQTYLSSKVASVVVSEYVQGDEQEADGVLSERERTVLKLIAEGKSSKEIAVIIDMSVQTVDACRRQMMEKLKVQSIAELVKYAIRAGLTSVDT